MQYKCQECNDTGGRDKIGAYFDCNACDAAATRRDLNDFVKSLTQRSTYPVHPEDVALAIHQRALAMAPKQEALGQEPVAYMHTMHQELGKFQNRLSEYDENPYGEPGIDYSKSYAVTCTPLYTAMAVDNGALPELPSPALEMTDLYTADQMRAYGQACAAAGSDAALIEALETLLHLVDEFGIKSGVCCCGDDMARHSNPMHCGHSPVDSGEYYSAQTIEVAHAALSGAKGN